LVQSTRRWDDEAGITEEMRTKEDAHDYRYFPEPDLMPFVPDDTWLANVQGRVVELPLARKQRFMSEYHLPEPDAETFKNDLPLGRYFEGIARQARSPKAVANWVINNLRAKIAEVNAIETSDQAALGIELEERKLTTLADLKFKPESLLELVSLVESGTLSKTMAQKVFSEMFETGKTASAIVEATGGGQLSDVDAIDTLCEEAIAANPKSVADYRAGKAAALNALKGQVMKLSKGKANPGMVGEVLERKLKG